MHSNKKKKLVRITLELTLLLTILNVFTPSIYATEWSSMPDTRLTWDESLDWAPSIAQAQDGTIWIVWHSFIIGTNPDIMYKVHNGSSTFPWSPTEKLTTDQGQDMTPSITITADGDIWVVWSSNRTGKYQIHYQVYNGSSWQPCGQLISGDEPDSDPSIMQAQDSKIWVVWGFTGTDEGEHTFAAVPIYAYGPNAEKFDLVTDNTELSMELFIAVSGYWH